MPRLVNSARSVQGVELRRGPSVVKLEPDGESKGGRKPALKVHGRSRRPALRVSTNHRNVIAQKQHT
eukprot:6554515-Pyramimonas_sp.AAC.1